MTDLVVRGGTVVAAAGSRRADVAVAGGSTERVKKIRAASRGVAEEMAVGERWMSQCS